MDYIVNSILIKRVEDLLRSHYRLVFESYDSSEEIIFDGLGFNKAELSQLDKKEFSVLKGYSRHDLAMPIRIVSVKHDLDVFFLQFENGFIFQFYFMMDNIESPQMFSIFRPGEPNYELALKRVNNCEDWSFTEH